MTLTGLRRYPVKSCRGADLRQTVVQRAGLAGDRRWMLVSADDGRMLTARTHPRLLLADPRPVEGGLVLDGPDLPALRVAEPDPAHGTEPVRVHRWPTAGVHAGDAADAWFSELLGERVRMLHLDDPDRRRPDPGFSRPDDRVSYADGYPLLLTSTGSLDALNALVASGPHAGAGPLSMIRFRPNLVVSGAPAWAEDGWRRLRVGDAEFRVVKGCSRCVLTTMDPATAVQGREPMVSLARHRRFDGGVWFGVNVVPDTPGAELRLGDPVEVLDGADPADGPPR